MKKNVRCAEIGQHPLRFPWGFDEEDDGCRHMKLEMAQRIIKQSGVVLAVYAPDLADGSAEDKAVSYALALGRTVPQPKSPVSYFGTIYISVRGCIINLNDYKSCRKKY